MTPPSLWKSLWEEDETRRFYLSAILTNPLEDLHSINTHGHILTGTKRVWKNVPGISFLKRLPPDMYRFMRTAWTNGIKSAVAVSLLKHYKCCMWKPSHEVPCARRLLVVESSASIVYAMLDGTHLRQPETKRSEDKDGVHHILIECPPKTNGNWKPPIVNVEAF